MKGKITTTFTIVIAFAILLLAMLPAAQAAVTQQLNCNQACLQVYSAEGECLLPKQFTAGLTPYTSLSGLCDQSQTCYCKKEPGLICNERCKGLNYTTGNCEIDQAGLPAASFTTPGYGYVSDVYRNPDVPCTSKGAGYSCICRKASAELQSAVAGLNVGFVWPSDKECAYIGGEGNYLITLSGTFGGASGLRIDLTNVPAAPVLGVTPFTPISSAGVPPAAINGFGWFLEMKKVPASSVEQLAASQGTAQAQINVRYTMIPQSGYSQIQNVYTQSFAANYPTSFGTVVGGNTFEDFVICETPTTTAVVEREPIEGPKEIKINSIVCTNAASVYENAWNLVDFRYSDANAFHFASGTSGSCTFTFSGTQDLYGIEARAAGNIIVSSIAIGRERPFNVSVPVGNPTSIAFADSNLTTPRRANTLTVNFEYTGSPALLELNPFPDVISIDALNVTPLTLATGDAMVISGTVSDHAFSAGGGLLHDCVYEWEGGCYPCIGRDCKPSATKPIGTPNFAILMPIPGTIFSDIGCFFQNGRKFNNATGKCDGDSITGDYLNKTPYFAGFGVKLTPPSNTYAFDIALSPGTKQKDANKFWIRTTFTNLLAMSVMYYVNWALNDNNELDKQWGDFWGRYGRVAILAVTTGLAPVEALLTGISQIGDALGLWQSNDAGISCTALAGPIGTCGMLGWSISNELTEGRCRDERVDPKTQNVWVTCNVNYVFWPYWDLESVPEPDPDKQLVGDANIANGYSLYDETCPHVSGEEKWLFNAGWWSFYGFFSDLISTIQHTNEAQSEQSLRDSAAATQTCDNCLRGVTTTERLSSTDATNIKQRLNTVCAIEHPKCIDQKSCGASGCKSCIGIDALINNPSSTEVEFMCIGASNPSCPTGFTEITTGVMTRADECTSAIEDKVAKAATTLAPGKWCAKAINASGTWYHSKDQTIEYATPAGAVRMDAGKCVLSTDSCDVAGFGKEGTTDNATWAVPPKKCGDLSSQTVIANAVIGGQLAEVKTCGECVATKHKIGDTELPGEWCAEIKDKTVKIGGIYVTLKEVLKSPGCQPSCPSDYKEEISDSLTGKVKATSQVWCSILDGITASQSQLANDILAGKLTAAQVNNRESALQQICGDEGKKFRCGQCLNYYGASGSISKWGVVWCVQNMGTTTDSPDYKLGPTTDETKCTPKDSKYIARTAGDCNSVEAQLRTLLGQSPKDLAEAMKRIDEMISNVNGAIAAFNGLVGSYDAVISSAEKLGTSGASIKSDAEQKKASILTTVSGLTSLNAELQTLKVEVNLQTVISRLGGASVKIEDSAGLLKNLQTGVTTLQSQVNQLLGLQPSVLMKAEDCKDPAKIQDAACDPTTQDKVGTVEGGKYCCKPKSLTCTIPSLPSVKTGQSYPSTTITCNYGTTPYTFSVSSGYNLPTGIQLNAQTGVLSGKVQATAGKFKIKVTDAANNVWESAELTITIVSPPTAKLSSLVYVRPGAVCNLGETRLLSFRENEDTFGGTIEDLYWGWIQSTNTYLSTNQFMSICLSDKLRGTLDADYPSFPFGIAVINDVPISVVEAHMACGTLKFLGVLWNSFDWAQYEIDQTGYKVSNAVTLAAYNAAVLCGKVTQLYISNDCHLDTMLAKFLFDLPGDQWYGATRDATGIDLDDDYNYAYVCLQDRDVGLTGSATSSELSQLGEIPEAPGTAPSFGLPTTGAAIGPYELLPAWMKPTSAQVISSEKVGASSSGISSTGQLFGDQQIAPDVSSSPTTTSSSFGPLSATGMQLGGLQGNSLMMQYIRKATSGFNQMWMSIGALTELATGTTLYRRTYTVQPGLDPQCPTTDPVNSRGIRTLPTQTSPGGKINQAKAPDDTPYYESTSQYYTSEGAIQSTDAPVYITIYKAGIWKDSQVYTPSTTGVYNWSVELRDVLSNQIIGNATSNFTALNALPIGSQPSGAVGPVNVTLVAPMSSAIVAAGVPPQMLVWNSTVTTGVNVTVRVDNTIQYSGAWKSSHAYTPVAGTHSWSVELANATSGVSIVNVSSNFTALATTALQASGILRLLSPLPGSTVLINDSLLLKWNSTVTAGIDVIVKVNGVPIYSPGIAPNCLNITQAGCWPEPTTDCYVPCQDIPVNASYGEKGVFRYLYSPKATGSYRVEVHTHGGSVGTLKNATFTVQNRTGASITALPNQICSEAGRVMTLAPVLTQPTIGSATAYTVSVTRVPERPSDQAGLVSCLDNGTCSRAAALNVTLQPNQTMALALESNVSDDTTVKLSVRDVGNVYGLSAQQSFLHKIVTRVTPDFGVASNAIGQASATTPGQSFDFQLHLTNNIAQGCTPTSWFLTKEAPGTGWGVWFNATTESATTSVALQGGMSTGMTLHVLPTAFNAIKTFPIYVLASEAAPARFVDTQPGTAAVVTTTDGSKLWYAGVDKKIRAVDVSTGAATEIGTVSDSITSIAADWGSGGNIYWISGGAIRQSAKTTFTPTALVSGLSTAARSIVVDGNMLYWTDGDAIKTASKATTASCGGTNCTLLNDVGITFGLAVDSTRVYWSGATHVWWASKGVSGNLATAMAIGTAGIMWTNKYAVGLAAGAAGSGIAGIYATLAPDANAATGKVVQLRANATGDDIFGFATTDYVYAIGQDFPKAVAVDKDWIYWIDRAGDVWRTPSDSLTDYVFVQYDYNPGPPSLDVRPSKAVAQAGTTVTYTLNLTNGAVVQIGYNFSLVNAPPANWTVTPIVPANGTLNAGASAIARINITSPVGAAGEFVFNVSVRVPNSDRVYYAPLIYNISNHTAPSVVATNISPTTASPGEAVRWQLNISNKDPAEYVTLSTILLNVTTALPEGWVAQFCSFTDAAHAIETCSPLANSLSLTMAPNTTNSSIFFYVQSPKQAADSSQNITVRATLDGLFNETNVTYTVFGCGNGICDPERGEYDLNITTGGPMCGALGNDCDQGYNDFQCYFSNSGLGRTWLECDRKSNTTADFGTRVAQNITDLNLTGAQLRVCKAGVSISACLATLAPQCGISRANVESPDVTIGNCVAQLTNSTTGAVGFGPLYTGSVQCPADAPNVAYYLLYFGRNGTEIQPDNSVGIPMSWTSANFTFSCPSYGVSIVGGANGLINHPIFGWKQKLVDCQRQYDIYAAAYGPGSVCAQVTLRACNIRRAHLENLTAVLTRPQELGEARAQQIVNSTATLDAQLDDAALRCAEVPALGIIGITLPGTKVGEIAQIRINVSNMLNLDYRGYAECKIILPDGSQHTYSSAAAGCTNFTANSTSVVSTAVVPVALTQPGVWNVTECTVWAESVYVLPESQCSQAATRFSSMNNIGTFNVVQSDFQINSPAQGELVKGTWPINIRADGYFDGVDWALSATSESCNGSTWSNLTTTSTEISKNWTGSWASSTVADATYWMCFRSRMAGFATLLGSLTVDTDNWAFIFNPVDAEIQARARISKTYNLTLRNTGTAADNYNITCASLAGWTTTMTSQGKSATCPSVLAITVNDNQTESIAVTTSVPNVATGTTVTFNFTSRGRYDAANATQRIIVSEIANDPPQLVNATTIPTTISSGQTIAFRARFNDPDGDNITTMRACRNADCSLVWCNLTGAAVERTCSVTPSVGAGTYDWWAYAEDALGLSRIEKASAFTISQPTVIQNGTQQNATTLSCAYTCMAACTNSTIDCKIRTDYGQRNCGESFVCCREATMPNCAPSTACAVIFERANCVWDPVALNYSVNAQVAWSAGVFAKISAAGTTSGPLSAKPAVFSGRVLSAGTYPVAATVYSLADEALCTNSTEATCVRPGTQPAASPVSGALPITSVSTSSSRPGNEANKATDGDQFTAWRSQEGMPQWLKLDLGISRTIGGVGIYSTVGRPLNFTISSSLDDVSYSLAATIRNASYTAANATDWNVTMFSSRDARYVLINVTEAEQNSTYIYEVQVYPGAVTAIPLPIPIPAAEFPMLIVVSIAASVVAVLILLAYRKRIALWWSFVRG